MLWGTVTECTWREHDSYDRSAFFIIQYISKDEMLYQIRSVTRPVIPIHHLSWSLQRSPTWSIIVRDFALDFLRFTPTNNLLSVGNDVGNSDSLYFQSDLRQNIKSLDSIMSGLPQAQQAVQSPRYHTHFYLYQPRLLQSMFLHWRRQKGCRYWPKGTWGYRLQ